MSPAEPPTLPETIDVRQLALAIRFVLVSVVLALSLLSLGCSLRIEGFGQIFNDMLNGVPLPVITAFVLRARFFFVALSVLVPLAAVATLFLRSVIRSLYLLGTLAFVAVVQIITIYYGMSAVLLQTIRALGGTPP